MSRHKCCCNRPCVICRPILESPERDDISDIMVERSGDWEVVEDITFGYLLRENGTAGAVATCLTRHPLNTPTGNLYATIANAVAGRKYRLIINYDPDTSTYLYLQAETVDGTNITAGIYTSSDVLISNEVTGISYTVAGYLDLALCRTETGIYGGVEDYPGQLYGCVSGYNGRWAGVGNGDTSTVTYRRDTDGAAVSFEEHTYTNPTKLCGTCGCECGGSSPAFHGKCVPQALKWTIAASGDCACADGTWAPLTLDPTEGEMYWKDNVGVTVPGCGTYMFDMECSPEGSNTSYLLHDKSTPPCSVHSEPDDSSYPASVQCDPLIITFQPEQCYPHDVGDPNCQMQIIVTEL